MTVSPGEELERLRDEDMIPGREKGLGKSPTVESMKSSVCILRFRRSFIVTEGSGYNG